MQAAVTLARAILAVVLVGAGVLKLGHAPDLAASIAGFRLLPPGATALIALVLPPLEIFIGLYLAAGLFTRIAGIITAAMFALYAGAIASAVLRGIPADCGCFGTGDHATADWPHVAFDLALALLAAFVSARGPGAFALDRLWNRT
jgi:uncharacterized membrane protein YphA (DoxX/SURF4 family)